MHKNKVHFGYIFFDISIFVYFVSVFLIKMKSAVTDDFCVLSRQRSCFNVLSTVGESGEGEQLLLGTGAVEEKGEGKQLLAAKEIGEEKKKHQQKGMRNS